MSAVYKCDVCGKIVEDRIRLIIHKNSYEKTDKLLVEDVCQFCRGKYSLAYILSEEWRKE